MIDLSDTVVGDEFKCSNDQYELVTLVYIGKDSERFIFENESGGMMIVDDNGHPIIGHSDNMHINSKVDTRHWLKDLPDADLFKLYQTSDIVCNQFGVWVANSLGAPTLTLCGNMMPKLKGDEWKLSKISIPDLKAWQEQSK